MRRSGHSSSALAIPRPDPFLRLLARLVREPDDGERRHAPLEVGLDLDRPRVEADERMGDGAREHASEAREESAHAWRADSVPASSRRS